MLNNCSCNDYSLLTTNTGIATISVANPNLDGSGTTVDVLTARDNGTIIKSVTIKAIQATTKGVVRLFIESATATTLIKEIMIPTSPSTLTPPPVLQRFQTVLVEDIKLKAGCKLVASTQNAESFIVVAEGLDWEYPDPLPDVCCNFIQETANTGNGVISVANTNLNGTGTIVPILTGNGNGTTIHSINIKAMQSTTSGMVRLFISPNGTNYFLMTEVPIPETIQASTIPAIEQLLLSDFRLMDNFVIGAATDKGEKFSISIDATDWAYPV